MIRVDKISKVMRKKKRRAKMQVDAMKEVTDKPNRIFSAEDELSEVIRELRDVPPLHYLFKIKNFSHLSNADNYESADFEVGGYNWKLSLHPKGNKKVNEQDHISLYLVLSKSKGLTWQREVNVCLKLFVYNQILDKYLAVQDAKGRVMRFRGTKREWGFHQVLPLNVFNDASNGYLINDCCVFGAEVFVIEGSRRGECVSAVKELDNNSYAWTIENFAGLEKDSHFSEVFVIGGYRWKLEFHPDGYWDQNSKSLSAYLDLEDEDTLKPGHSLYAEFVLRVRDQIHGKHHERTVGKRFSSSTSGTWGFADLIPLSKLHDPSQGYISNGAMILEVQISMITKVKEFS